MPTIDPKLLPYVQPDLVRAARLVTDPRSEGAGKIGFGELKVIERAFRTALNKAAPDLKPRLGDLAMFEEAHHWVRAIRDPQGFADVMHAIYGVKYVVFKGEAPVIDRSLSSRPAASYLVNIANQGAVDLWRAATELETQTMHWLKQFAINSGASPEDFQARLNALARPLPTGLDFAVINAMQKAQAEKKAARDAAAGSREQDAFVYARRNL